MGIVIKTGDVDWEKFVFEGEEEKGVRMKAFCGDKVMIGIFETSPDYPGHRFHKHDDEQIGFVLQGKRRFFWVDEGGEKSEVLEKGCIYILKSNELHCSKPLGSEKFVVMEIWSPPPQRYMEIAIKGKNRGGRREIFACIES